MPPKRKVSQDEATEEKATLFSDMVFFLASKLNKAKATVTKDIRSAGGVVSSTFSKKVTHVIGTQEDYDGNNESLLKAEEEGLEVLTEDFIYECINQQKKLDASSFRIKGGNKPKKQKKEEEDKEEKQIESHETKNVKTITVHKKGKAFVDNYCPRASSCHVIEEGSDAYDAMLNQTDITYGIKGHNKFYVIQALEDDKGNAWFCWTRWGRVGVAGQNKLSPCPSKQAAINEFKKKFKEKTSNNWENRANFKHVSGKYDLIEMDYGGDEQNEQEIQEKLEEKRNSRGSKSEKSVSKLDKRTKDLLSILFDMKMYTSTLLSFSLDIKKMPLGKISKNQIQKGYEILEEIESILKGSKQSRNELAQLCNRFYTIIPHDFGFKLPPIIDNLEALQQKMDLLEVLGDIEIAQKMMEEQKGAEEDPFDAKYASLKNNIFPLDKNSQEWKLVENFMKFTMQQYNLQLIDVFALDRHGESDLFKRFDNIDHRKMLWHGTNIAVVPAILSTGLRIMPHSGGRVGRGLYFADVIAKSASYCGLHDDIGFIFLNEVALGKIHTIYQDDSSLRNPPKGYNSILATGSIHPDPSYDFVHKTLSKSGNPVIFPQGKVVNSGVKNTSFLHNEYLVYDQEQVTMKYLCMIRWAK